MTVGCYEENKERAKREKGSTKEYTTRQLASPPPFQPETLAKINLEQNITPPCLAHTHAADAYARGAMPDMRLGLNNLGKQGNIEHLSKVVEL